MSSMQQSCCQTRASELSQNWTLRTVFASKVGAELCLLLVYVGERLRSCIGHSSLLLLINHQNASKSTLLMECWAAKPAQTFLSFSILRLMGLFSEALVRYNFTCLLRALLLADFHWLVYTHLPGIYPCFIAVLFVQHSSLQPWSMQKVIMPVCFNCCSISDIICKELSNYLVHNPSPLWWWSEVENWLEGLDEWSEASQDCVEIHPPANWVEC